MLSAALICLIVGVTDGDTLKARCGEPGHYEQITVRLAAIDAPESRQPFGSASRQSLAALCFQQYAKITQRTLDRYGRTVADVSCRGEDAGAAQVASGMAWVYERYAHPTTDARLFAAQAKAQTARAGLWVDAAPVPPWSWRNAAKSAH